MSKITCAINFKKTGGNNKSSGGRNRYMQLYEHVLRKRMDCCVSEIFQDMLSEFKTSGRIEFSFDETELEFLDIDKNDMMPLEVEKNNDDAIETSRYDVNDRLHYDDDAAFEAVAPDIFIQNNRVDSVITDEVSPDHMISHNDFQPDLLAHDVSSDDGPSDNLQDNFVDNVVPDETVPENRVEVHGHVLPESNSHFVLEHGKERDIVVTTTSVIPHTQENPNAANRSKTISQHQLIGSACIFLEKEGLEWRLFDYMFKKGYIGNPHLFMIPRKEHYYLGVLEFVTLNNVPMMVTRPIYVVYRLLRGVGDRIVPKNTNTYYATFNSFLEGTDQAFMGFKASHCSGGVASMTFLANWEINNRDYMNDPSVINEALYKKRNMSFVRLSEFYFLTAQHRYYRHWLPNADDKAFRTRMKCPTGI